MGIPIGMILLLVLGVIVVGTIIAIAAVSARKETVNVAVGEGSYFDGNTWQLIGYRILSALVNTITLGIAYPWMLCMVQRWEVKHTVIHGRRLKFNGHGHQLIGKYLLWVFLTIITFGIYGIWLGLGMKKWVVKHTVYADEERPVDSYFSGGAGGYLGIHILSFVLTLFTLGIGKAWADKMVLKWEAKHTHIGGSPLEFNGTGGQLFGKYLLLVLLTPLTLGIYALFFTVIYMKWQVKHTEAVYQTPEIQAKAKAHEMTVVQDFAKYRIAANDQEIAAMKSGYTGKEDNDTLERLAEEGNPFAAYHLAKQLKGESAVYEGRALELLQKAADGKVHSALLDLAKQLPSEQRVSMLIDAAQYGNAEASWLLAVAYQKTADLTKAAYWFKVALEWGVADAKARTAEYDDLVKNIALQLSESREMPKQSKVLPIVLGVVGVLMIAGIVFGVLLFRVVPSNSSRTVRIYSNSMVPTLESGDVIYLNDDIEDIEVGDIIAFICNESGAIAAHRVVEVITDDDGGIWYVTKGDNNTAPDANPVHPSNVIGVYDRKAGLFGKIFGGLSNRTTAVAVVNNNYDWDADLDGDGTESFPYVITNAYDFQKYIECFDSDSPYGTIASDFEIYASPLYYGNNESNAKFFEKQVERGYLRFQNGDIKVTYQGVEIVCENRINLTDTIQPSAPANEDTDEATTSTESKVNIADSIVGEWVLYNVNPAVATGVANMDFKKWVFRSDGTCAVILEYYYPSPDGSGINYDGTFWSLGSGNSYPGTYTLSGSKLFVTVDVSEPGDSADMSTTEYTVEISENTLSLYYQSGKTERYEKAN